jgi:hypothetical protein
VLQSRDTQRVVAVLARQLSRYAKEQNTYFLLEARNGRWATKKLLNYASPDINVA